MPKLLQLLVRGSLPAAWIAVASCSSDDTVVVQGGSAGVQEAGAEAAADSEPVEAESGVDAADAAEESEAVSEAGPSGSVACGQQACVPPQVCCGYASELVCTSAADCAGDFHAECDDAEDCEGGMCCGGPGQDSTQCKSDNCEPAFKICTTQEECGCGFNCCPFETLGWTASFCTAAPCT